MAQTPIKKNSASSSSSSSLSLRTPDQVQQDLYYLQEHRVCETLEFIVKGLLRDQPEDPVLSICNMLRSSNRSNSSVRNSANGHTVFSHSRHEDQRPNTVSSVCTPVTGGDSTGMKAFPITLHESGRADGAAAAQFRAAASASSRADTPASSVPHNKWNDTQSNSNKLERDESSRSDGSAFSISSIDMSEFLSEFRAAHMSLFGEQREVPGGALITLGDLADIVDRIAIPLPDVKLLVDLFQELKEPSASNEGVVSFDAFLARMNFKIQGRYPIESIRAAFFTLLPADVVALARPASAVAGSRGLTGNGSVGSNLDAYLMGSSGVDVARDSTADVQAVSQLLQSTPSVATRADKIIHTALWRGLGLRTDAVVLDSLLLPFRRGGGPVAEYTLFFTDFLKIVQTLCGQGKC